MNETPSVQDVVRDVVLVAGERHIIRMSPAAMHDVKHVAEQCKVLKHADLKLDPGEEALHACDQEHESVRDAQGVLRHVF